MVVNNEILNKIRNELMKKKVFLTFVENKGWSIFGLNRELPDKLSESYDIIEDEIKKGVGLIIVEEQLKSNLLILLNDKDRKIRLETNIIISRIPTIITHFSRELKVRIRKEKDFTIKAISSWILAIDENFSPEKATELLRKALTKEQDADLRFELLLMLVHFEGLQGKADKILFEMVKKRELKEWQFCEYKMKTQVMVFLDIMKNQHEENKGLLDIVDVYITESMNFFQHIMEAKESYDNLPEIEKIKRQADELLIEFNKEKPAVPEIERRMSVLSQYLNIRITSKESLFKRWGGELIGALIGAIISGVITFLITYFLV